MDWFGREKESDLSWRMENCGIPNSMNESISTDPRPLLHLLLNEYRHLLLHLPSGMVVVPSFETLLIWHGVLFVKEGWFKGGVFKFHIDIPVDYPASAPRVTFDSQVFHPLVDRGSGALDLSPAFPTWTPGRDYLVLVVSYLKKIFFKKDLNGFYLRMMRSDFIDRCEECVAESLRLVYVSASPIEFQVWKNRSRVRSLLENQDLPVAPGPFEVIQDAISHLPPDLPLEVQVEAFTDWLLTDFIPKGDAM